MTARAADPADERAAAAPPTAPTPSYAAMATPAGLAGVARYADGIGPERTMILPRDRRRRPAWSPTRMPRGSRSIPGPSAPRISSCPPPTAPAPIRAEHGRLADEIGYFLGLGVDGIFTDYPYIAVSGACVGSPLRPPN